MSAGPREQTEVCGEARDQWRCTQPAGHTWRHSGYCQGVLREWPNPSQEPKR
jgi:hypothetical protein